MPCFILLVVLGCLVPALAQSPAPNTASDTKGDATRDALSAADALFKQGKFQQAALAYAGILKKDSTSAQANAGAVQSYIKADDVKAADENSQQALAALPQSAIAHAMRGDVYFRQGLMSQAESEYKAALKLDDNCARAWLGMGRINSVVVRRKNAKQAFTRAHELDPQDGDIIYHWALRLPYPQNVAELEKHLAEYHSDPEKERRELEYIGFLKNLAGRKIWIPARPVEHTEIKLEPLVLRPRTPQQGFTLQVKFNDRTSSSLLVDTGASGVTIKRKLAEKIGATRLSEHSLKGIGDSGLVGGYDAWVDKISIGELEFHDCVVHVSSKDSVGGEDGLIGTNIFEDYLVTLDFPESKLKLSQLPKRPDDGDERRPPDAQSFTQVFSFGHLLLMPTHVGSTASGLFVLDTGAFTNSISPVIARQVSKVHDSNVRVQGISGEVKDVYRTDKALLQFARFRQPNEEVVTFDVSTVSKSVGTEVSGFIGFTTLKRFKVIIDYRDGLVDFDYKQ
jgi:tetratricopeptide (TPR) repeat protein